MIANGKLIAHATSYYLKNKYGRGYYLIISKKREIETNSRIVSSNASRSKNRTEFKNSKLTLNVVDDYHQTEQHLLATTSIDQAVHGFIKSRIESSILIKNNPFEMIYSISNKPEDTQKYGEVFKELENQKNELNIESIGLSDTTLEEVFIRLAKEPETNKNNYKSNWFFALPCFQLMYWKNFFSKIPLFKTKKARYDITEEDSFQYTNKRVNNKLNLLIQQSYALLIKRFHRVKRNFRGFVAEIVLPVIFVALALFVAVSKPKITNNPPLELHPWLTSDTNDYLNYIFYRQYFNEQKETNNLTVIKHLTQTFYDNPSIGTRCLNNHQIMSPVTKKVLPCDRYGYTIVENGSLPQSLYNSLLAVNYSNTKIAPSCSCATGFPNCPIGSAGDVDYKFVSHLITRDTLDDLTERNVSDWLINTEFSQKYFQKRFGGFDFSNSADDADVVTEVYNAYSMLINSGSSAKLKKQKAKIWFNNKGYFTAVSYLNSLNNAILRSKVNKRNSQNVGIIAINHPLPYTVQQLNDKISDVNNSPTQVFVSICLIFALSFIPASFLIFVVDERASNAKQLQFVSGIKPYIYWIANYVWDIINYILPCFICISLFAIFNVKSYTTEENFSSLICLMLMYGWASK